MFIPWWVIILGIIVVASIAGSGKSTLRRRIAELEEQIGELEDESESDSDNSYTEDFS